MKRPILILIPLMLLLCSCKHGEPVTETATVVCEPQYVTDINGELVPVHKDVNISRLQADLFSFNEKGRIVYGDSSVKINTGIDISAFQGDIDWDAVADDGIDYVMLRIGGRGYGEKGLLYEDEKFFENYEKAVAAGIKTGVYFFSQAATADEAKEEAEFVLSRISNLDIDYPVAFDWEHVDDPEARTANMTDDEITACAKAFCSEIKNSGREAIIYFNRSQGYFSYKLSELKDYHFWLAEYSEIPSFIYDYKMWQFTEKGKVNGISSPVDINISFLDYSEETEAEAVG